MIRHWPQSLGVASVVCFAALAVTTPIVNAASGDAAADRVLGQSNFTSKTNPCDVGGFSAKTLCGTKGIAVDSSVTPNRLYLTDGNRVLGYPTAEGFRNGSAAKIVLGQPDFTTNTENNGGIGRGSLFNAGAWRWTS